MSREQVRQLFDSSKKYVIATNDALPVLDGQNLVNVKTASEKFDFWGDDISGRLSWNQEKTIASVTHNLNCIPLVQVMNSAGELIHPTISVLSGSAFTMDFGVSAAMLFSEENPGMVSIVYGGEYGPATQMVTQMATLATQTETAKNESVDASVSAATYAAMCQSAYNSIVSAYGMILLGACTDLGIVYRDNKVMVSWRDPENVLFNGNVVTKWWKTELWRMQSDVLWPEYPGCPGAVLIGKTEKSTDHMRDFYSENPLVDDSVEANTPYSYALFSYNESGTYNTLAANRFPMNTTWSGAMLHAFSQAGSLLNYVSIGQMFSMSHPEFDDKDGLTEIPIQLMDYDGVEPWDIDVNPHVAVFQTVNCLFSQTQSFGSMYFDAPENQYALTADTVAVSGKTYYRRVGTEGAYTFEALVEGEGEGEYQVGDAIPGFSWYERNPAAGSSQYGRNLWDISDLRAYLNSDGSAGEWWSPKTIWEYQCNYANRNGFLKNLEAGVKENLVPVRRKIARSTSYGGGYYETMDRIFLPTRYEVAQGSNNGVQEGIKVWKWYEDNSNERRVKLLGGNPVFWWLASPHASNANGVYYVTATGTTTNDYALHASGVSPAFGL